MVLILGGQMPNLLWTTSLCVCLVTRRPFVVLTWFRLLAYRKFLLLNVVVAVLGPWKQFSTIRGLCARTLFILLGLVPCSCSLIFGRVGLMSILGMFGGPAARAVFVAALASLHLPRSVMLQNVLVWCP